jgi:hypothetical protein
MADANSTADLTNNVFDKRLTTESIGEQIHKLEFLQGVLTLQEDGNLPDHIHTSGLYYIMDDVINGLKTIHGQINSLEINLRGVTA